jgi:hypothetical protein
MRRRRAQSIARRLGLLPCATEPGRRGLLLLQVDALSYYALQASLDPRFAPFLSRLLKKRGYRLHKYQTGIPATTPAFQVGLFWGKNAHVAGFRYFDRRARRVVNVKRPEDAAEVEQIAAAQAPGLLEGGACHCSIVAGGAERSSMVISRLASGPPEPEVQQTAWGVVILALLNVWMVIRLLFAAAFEIGVELAEGVKAEYDGKLTRSEWPFVGVRALTNVVFRELAARNVLLDIARGIPVIYANFAGYDELAHHRGPMSLAARLALRGTDARLREIFRAASRYGARDYDIYVFSDHGQVPTVPFDKLVGRTLEDELSVRLLGARELPRNVTNEEMGRLRTLVGVQRELEQILPRRWGWIAQRIGNYVEAQLPRDPEHSPFRDLAEVMFLPTSDLCHLYVTHTAEPLSLDQLRSRQPALIDTLVHHRAVWAIIGRGVDPVHGPIAQLESGKGAAFIRPSGQYHFVGEDPFQAADFPEGTPAALYRFAWSPNAGDAVLFGARIHGHAVNFQEELGGHGGPYAEEQTAFIISPPHVDFDFSRVRHHSELYDFFYPRYRRREA